MERVEDGLLSRAVFSFQGVNNGVRPTITSNASEIKRSNITLGWMGGIKVAIRW